MRRAPPERVRTRERVERLEGFHPVREALRARRRVLHRLWVRPQLRHAGLATLRALAQEARVPEEALSLEAPPDKGIALEVGPLPELSLQQLLQAQSSAGTLVALDGVEDPHNLGAIARVAEATGAQGLVLTRRRAPPLSSAVSRASAGAIEWLPVVRVSNLSRALAELKKREYWVFGADVDEGEDLFGLPDRALRGGRVIVLGSEGRGLRPAIQIQVDHRVRIPMWGKVDSLNVSTAAAVLLFEVARRQQLANLP